MKFLSINMNFMATFPEAAGKIEIPSEKPKTHELIHTSNFLLKTLMESIIIQIEDKRELNNNTPRMMFELPHKGEIYQQGPQQIQKYHPSSHVVDCLWNHEN